jgi:hypothetical protein
MINGAGSATSPCEMAKSYGFISKFRNNNVAHTWTKVFKDTSSIPWVSLVSDGTRDYNYMGALLIAPNDR